MQAYVVREQQGRMSREMRVRAGRAGQVESTTLPTSGAVPWYLSKKGRAGLVIITRVSHSPETASQVHSAKARPRSSREVKQSRSGSGRYMARDRHLLKSVCNAVLWVIRCSVFW